MPSAVAPKTTPAMECWLVAEGVSVSMRPVVLIFQHWIAPCASVVPEPFLKGRVIGSSRMLLIAGSRLFPIAIILELP